MTERGIYFFFVLSPAWPKNRGWSLLVALELTWAHVLGVISDDGILGSLIVTCMVSLQNEVVATATEEPKKLWGGRFTGETDPLMEKFNESLPMDRRMYAEDIKVILFAFYCSLP